MSHFVPNLIVLARSLRQAGLPVGTDRILTLTEALRFIDIASKEDVKAACRAVLIQRHEDVAVFEQVFEDFRFSQPQGRESDEIEISSETLLLRTWSDLERISTKDFAELTADERTMVRSALERLAWDIDEHRTRRWTSGRGRRIDLRRAMARSLRTGGEITTLPRRQRRTRPRPIVLLCDVSGSMELYTRTLLLFAHALSRRRRDVEAFLFATRLTRITNELRAGKPDAAMNAVSRAVKDWAGGTRIGEALRVFHQHWRRRTLHSSSIVILISDGWDRGDPRVLRDEIARLHRSCHRLIWLNPLIGTIDYAPLTRGLEAALPFVDDFLPVRTLRDIRDLALHLGALNRHGHHRHLHVHRATRQGLGADDGSGGDRLVHPGV
ncbi:MAG: VWA domain-containing protein [Cyanobacteria bacterium]|nr:VWA domain-containing protein [Cyanobacteriota bacterium]